MPRWTDDQQAAMDARNPDLLVSAAAGSGKTAVLVERIVQLAKKGAQIDRMLIVTFTRAAAGEMRERIAARLAQGADEGDETMHRQLSRMENCQISTIHGFCQKVLREHFQAVGLDPQTRLCDPNLKDRLFDEAAQAALVEAFEAENEDFDSLALCFEQDAILSMLKELYTFLMSLEDPWGWLEEKLTFDEDLANHPWATTLLQDLSLQLQGMEPLLKEMKALLARPEAVKAYEPLWLEDDLNARELLKASGEGLEALRQALDRLKWQRAPISRGLQSDQAQWVENYKALRESLKKIAAEVFKQTPLSLQAAGEDMQAMAPALRGLALGVKTLHTLFIKAKEDLGVMDFDDLEHLTLKILSNESLRAILSESYDHIFVDEYQDVSQIQEAIIQRLHGENNLLFMVGDVKQSIYRFRLADPTLFLTKQETFSKEETAQKRKLVLQKNFRSQAQVLHGVNHVFDHVMQREITEIAYDADARLVPGREDQGDNCLSLHLILKEKGEEPGAEYQAVAQQVLAALKTQIPDRHTGQMRPCRLKDIAILLPKIRGVGAEMAQALKDQGIPVYLEGDEEYFDLPEVHTLMETLKVVDNPCQDLPLLTALSLPCFQLTREEQAKIRLLAPRRDQPYYRAFHKACEAQGPLGDKCRKARDLFEEWRFVKDHLPLDQFIWRVLADTGMYLQAGALPGGENRQGNLRLLCQRAYDYAHTQQGGLAGFLKEGEALRTAQDRTTAKLLGEGEDLVRLMTIHKSKGLEFPVTIVASLGQAMHQPQKSRLLMHKELGLAMDYVNPRDRITRPTLAKTAIALRKRLEEKAEKARLLYVAMTRARERLILVGTVKKYPQPVWQLPLSPYALYAAPSLLDWVCQALWKTQPFPRENESISTESTAYPQAAAPWKITVSGDIIHIPVENNEDFHTLLSDLQKQLTTPVDELTAERLEAASQPRPPALPLKTSVSALCRHTPWENTEEDALEKALPQWTVAPLTLSPLPELPGFLSQPEETDTGAARGTAVHQALSGLDYGLLGDASGKALYARVAQQADDMARRCYLTPEQREAIPLHWLCRFLESDLGQRARNAQEMHREWAFNFRLPQAPETLVQGVIDLCFVEDGQWVLLDYKTDYYEDPTLLKKRYGPQLRLYRQALEAITRRPVKETCLYGLRRGDRIEVEENYEGDLSS
ncbi:MAG: helicase-exonuclease AddAB subunit AddA [Clostridia bacterium]|nr:helicase-exonuclease AddAB subunit AddA [Clostridia bacterium]